jgi:hypothetical protein
MSEVEDNRKSVKVYSLKAPVYADTHDEYMRIMEEHSIDCFTAHDMGLTSPPVPLVSYPMPPLPREVVQKIAASQVVNSSHKLFMCGDIWEHYSFFDEYGNPLLFQSGYTLPETEKPEDVAKRAVGEALQEECETAINEAIEHLDDLEKAPMSEDEKQAERQRYIRRVKQEIRRLVNLNHLTYMYTLTFALELNENVYGLRFILPEADQRDRAKVLDAWNVRLTDIRRWMAQEGREFRFVVVLEIHDSDKTDPRKIGTYHIHLATDKPIDKHELQRKWGYGVVWIDNFKKNKRTDEATGRTITEAADFLKDPGRYLAKYLEKEINNPQFICQHAYSSSRGNLKRPKDYILRDEEQIQKILKNPRLAYDYGVISEALYHKILKLKHLDQVKSYDNQDKLKEVDIKLPGGETRKIYVRYRIYNFRLLMMPKKAPDAIQEKLF